MKLNFKKLFIKYMSRNIYITIEYLWIIHIFNIMKKPMQLTFYLVALKEM